MLHSKLKLMLIFPLAVATLLLFVACGKANMQSNADENFLPHVSEQSKVKTSEIQLIIDAGEKDELTALTEDISSLYKEKDAIKEFTFSNFDVRKNIDQSFAETIIESLNNLEIQAFSDTSFSYDEIDTSKIYLIEATTAESYFGIVFGEGFIHDLTTNKSFSCDTQGLIKIYDELNS
ncbi:MAG: hypothetical protein RR048_01905 [Oscillospiraceae bacterium]